MILPEGVQRIGPREVVRTVGDLLSAVMVAIDRIMDPLLDYRSPLINKVEIGEVERLAQMRAQRLLAAACAGGLAGRLGFRRLLEEASSETILRYWQSVYHGIPVQSSKEFKQVVAGIVGQMREGMATIEDDRGRIHPSPVIAELMQEAALGALVRLFSVEAGGISEAMLRQALELAQGEANRRLSVDGGIYLRGEGLWLVKTLGRVLVARPAEEFDELMADCPGRERVVGAVVRNVLCLCPQPGAEVTSRVAYDGAVAIEVSLMTRRTQVNILLDGNMTADEAIEVWVYPGIRGSDGSVEKLGIYRRGPVVLAPVVALRGNGEAMNDKESDRLLSRVWARTEALSNLVATHGVLESRGSPAS